MEYIFTKEKIGDLLANLAPETPARWGLMTPQHMLEHLALLFKIMDGRKSIVQIVPEDKVEKAQNRLRDPDWEMPMQFKAAFLPAEELLPLEWPDLESAKARLLAEMDDFETFFEKNPEVRPLHPYFGPCDKNLWQAIQNKHFYHHFKQFGLVGGDV